MFTIVKISEADVVSFVVVHRLTQKEVARFKTYAEAALFVRNKV